MSPSDVEYTRVGVLVHPEHTHVIEDASWRSEDAVIEVADHVEGALARTLERTPDVVVAAGGDAFIGELVSTYEFAPQLKRHALRLYPARVSDSSQLAQSVGAHDFSPRLVRRLVKAARSGKLDREQVDSLKVTVSSEPEARVGFNFGAGLFYRLFDAYRRAQTERSSRVAGTLLGMAKDTLLEGGRNLEPVSARVSVDGEPLTEELGYLVCSSLPSTWMGLDMKSDARRPSFRAGAQGRELIKKVVSSRTLPGFVRTDHAEGFERLVIDWSSGCVLDGELVEPGCAHALRVRRGPVVECVRL